MKKLFILVLILCINSNMFSQSPTGSGFYKTHEDFLNRKTEYIAEDFNIMNTTISFFYSGTRVFWTDKNGTKQKINPDKFQYYGIRMPDETEYIFHKKQYRLVIVKGDISLFTNVAFGVSYGVNDVIIGYETTYEEVKMYYQKGDQTGIAFSNANLLSLLEDEPDVLKKAKNAKSLSAKNKYMNWITFAQLYNMKKGSFVSTKPKENK